MKRLGVIFLVIIPLILVGCKPEASRKKISSSVEQTISGTVK